MKHVDGGTSGPIHLVEAVQAQPTSPTAGAAKPDRDQPGASTASEPTGAPMDKTGTTGMSTGKAPTTGMSMDKTGMTMGKTGMTMGTSGMSGKSGMSGMSGMSMGMSGKRAPLSRAQKWAITALVVGALAPPLDSTIVTIATHVLATKLHTGVDTVQWVITAYLLALAVAIPVSGWAERRFGGKAAWLVGLTVFIVGSIASACAWDIGSLITFRAFQGFGGGLIVALMQTLAMQVAGGSSGVLVAAISVPMAIAPILGPVVGGLVINAWGWRWMFLINVPLIALAIGASWRLLHTPPPPTGAKARLDVIGLGLITPGLVLALFGLSRSAQAGFGHVAVIVPIVAGLVLLAGFVWWALRRGGAALVNVRLLGHRSLAAATAVFVTLGVTMYATMFLLPLFWQLLKGYSPLEAGLLLIPQGVGALVVRTFIGKIVDRHSPRLITALAFLLTAAATVPFAFATHSWSNWVLCVVLFVRGFGMGSLMIPAMAVSYQDVSTAQYPDATMLTRIAQQLGASFGTAIVAVALAAGTRHSTEAGFHSAFWWATGMTLAAALIALALPQRRPGAGGMRM